MRPDHDLPLGGEMEPWANLLTNFGLATMILIALGYASWQTLGWIGREIVIPMRDKLLLRMSGFFDRIDTTMDRLNDNIATMSTLLEKQTATLGTLERSAAESASVLQRIEGRLNLASSE